VRIANDLQKILASAVHWKASPYYTSWVLLRYRRANTVSGSFGHPDVAAGGRLNLIGSIDA
jgi:hypothetical protein